MPVYEYQCVENGHRFDLYQSVGADPPACPVCGSATRKVYTSVGLIFKGSGFHVNDYRRPGAREGETDGKPEGKEEGKPDGKHAAAADGPSTGAAKGGDDAADGGTTKKALDAGATKKAADARTTKKASDAGRTKKASDA